MERHKPVLYVHTGPHFEGGAHEHTHLTASHLCEQLLLPRFCVRFVDKRDLLPWNTAGDQLIPNIVIHGKAGLIGVLAVDQPL